MNKKIFFSAIIALAMTACSESEDWVTDDTTVVDDTSSDNGSSSSSSNTITGSLASSELLTFGIAIDSVSTVTETEVIESGDENGVANNSFDSTITIRYNGTAASVAGSVEGVEVSVTGADVTVTSTVAGVNYVLSGTTTEGQFKIYSDKKFCLTLNGVNINNSDGPAINSQSGKRAFIVVNDGTINNLSDGTSYASSDEDQKGTIFAEGKLIFSGSGKLRINANAKAGISADDWVLVHRDADIYVKSTKGNGIKANDDITINGGRINIEVSGTAAKGISSDGTVNIAGGRTIILTTGGGEYDSEESDVSASAGVKADSTMTVTGGELFCKSTGQGGKGISTDQQLLISGGTVKVITTGKTYTYSSDLDSKAKGIKSDGDLTISGGTVMVRATGGEGSEGIESKGVMTIEGGVVESYSYDDALNSSSHMYIKGGSIFACGTNNDGIDANGNVYIQGGTTVAYGASSPEQGIDANTEERYSLIITGGTVVGVGGGTTSPSSQSTQPSIIYGGQVSSGTALTLRGSETSILSFTMERSYNGSAVFLISTPELKAGSSYTLYGGNNLLASYSSLSSPYSSSGNAGGMGGGGWGGRP